MLETARWKFIVRETLQRQSQKPFSLPNMIHVEAHSKAQRVGAVLQTTDLRFDHMRGIRQTKLNFIRKTRSSWALYKNSHPRKFDHELYVEDG